MHLLVTGSKGFIGKNLLVRLRELAGYSVSTFDRGDDPAALGRELTNADAVVHLAGVNRPSDIGEFETGNVGLTEALCGAFRKAGRRIPLIVASSTQATLPNPYGRSKLAAEQVLERFALEYGSPVILYRLPGVFGKWCKPNYNSVVATFCHNIANDLPININDPSSRLRLVYVDDVVDEFLGVLQSKAQGITRGEVLPEYTIAVGELAVVIGKFRSVRENLTIERVGAGLERALYATYVSYLPPSRFSYSLPKHEDKRGEFVEVLKTLDSGQFSYFTAHPGVTRGGHYHHSKSEKFLVIRGEARFRFRHLVTSEVHELLCSGGDPRIVETVPGWSHDVTNVGREEMIVMLWANEIFDHSRPDTIACEV